MGVRYGSGYGEAMPLILVVEDNPHTAIFVRIALEDASFVVIHMDSARVCLESICQVIPDLVLMDLMLPDMVATCSGRSELSECRANPVIAFSASHELLASAEWEDFGYACCLRKPIGRAELFAAVRRVLANGDTAVQVNSSEETVPSE